MDSHLTPTNPTDAGTARRASLATGCALSVNKLTLVTFVIAVAGFAGTAFAADPPSFDPQAVPTAVVTC